jgi:hypothetical protein
VFTLSDPLAYGLWQGCKSGWFHLLEWCCGAVEVVGVEYHCFSLLAHNVVSMQCMLHDGCWDHVSGGTAELFAVSTTSALPVCPCCVSVEMCAVQRQLQICG